jgi:hypothetical protein
MLCSSTTLQLEKNVAYPQQHSTLGLQLHVRQQYKTNVLLSVYDKTIALTVGWSTLHFAYFYFSISSQKARMLYRRLTTTLALGYILISANNIKFRRTKCECNYNPLPEDKIRVSYVTWQPSIHAYKPSTNRVFDSCTRSVFLTFASKKGTTEQYPIYR